MKKLALAAALLLGACATSPDVAPFDQVGYMYPMKCRGDLSWVKADVRVVPRTVMRAASPPGYEALGMTFQRGPGEPALIWISDHLSGWRYDDALRHERCHVVAGHWHPPRPPQPFK